jgi:CheY-like chemotaxis protein
LSYVYVGMTATACDTVLVIDDEPAVLDSTVALLASHGYRAVGVYRARDALGFLRAGTLRPRLIVLDLMMPGMSGWQFRTELLCDEDLASIPVVVVSASGQPVVAAAAEAMRAAAGMVKPVDGDELLRVVDTYCRPTLH